MLNGHLYTAPAGCRGFDCNVPLTANSARAFAQKGYRFAVRYVRRQTYHSYDLNAKEAETILAGGLALMLVQHVESAESWEPSGAKGMVYGATAGECAELIGLPPGSMLWCDLEGVAAGTESQSVIDYCNNWHATVAARGFLPGLYVGWHCGLNAAQLYRSLRFTHYWSAYNLNAEEMPAVRGVQMRQRAKRAVDNPVGVTMDFDVDVIQPDALGSTPVLFASEQWAALLPGVPL